MCLDEVGNQPDFIKKRLRWVGESYRVYLRDTNEINEQHRDPLKASLEATMTIIEHVEGAVLEELLPEDAHQAEEYEAGDYFDLAHQCLCLGGVFRSM